MKPLVAIDDSSPSKAAMEALLRIQVPEGTEATLLTVLEPSPPLATGMKRWEVVRDHLRQRRLNAKAFLEREARPLREAGFQVRIVVDQGHTADKIITVAHDSGADLIVVGSHGRGMLRRLVLGGVSHRVVLHASCSVLVAHSHEEVESPPVDGRPMKVLVAFDDSESSWRALKRAANVQWRSGVDVTVQYVHDAVELTSVASGPHELELQQEEDLARRALQGAAELFEGPGSRVTTKFSIGHPPREILATAEELDVDLVVVGDKGQSTVSRFLLGSVTHRVVNEAHCSVLVMRP